MLADRIDDSQGDFERFFPVRAGGGGYFILPYAFDKMLNFFMNAITARVGVLSGFFFIAHQEAQVEGFGPDFRRPVQFLFRNANPGIRG